MENNNIDIMQQIDWAEVARRKEKGEYKYLGWVNGWYEDYAEQGGSPYEYQVLRKMRDAYHADPEHNPKPVEYDRVGSGRCVTDTYFDDLMVYWKTDSSD